MDRVRVKLILINGRAMTFSADDYMKLRKEHRIVGKLIGVSPPFPRNVNLLHLPAVYSDFETRLMLDEGIATLEQKNLNENPTEEMKIAFNDYQKTITEELQVLHMKNKLDNTRLNMEQIIKGKRKKLLKSGIPENEINIRPENILKEEEEKYRQTYNKQNLHSHIPLEHPFITPIKTIESFPVDNMTKYQIFHDLWKKGFYITNAENFGGDFLTYKGDPIYYHATQIVHVTNQNDLLQPHFLISCGRLSVSVKKKCLFAYVVDNCVVYQTLEWDNPKVKEMCENNELECKEKSLLK